MDIVERTQSVLLSLGAAPVMWLMIGLSIFSVAIMLERAWFFRGISGGSTELARDLAARLRRGDRAEAARLLSESPTVEAIVVAAGLRESERGPRAAREAMASAALQQRKRLERRLAYLGTLGSNAPFVGLFGTVIGIVMAFDELGAAGATNAGAGVMASIAEALVATAIVLAVAIPAIAAFNGFQRRIKTVFYDVDALGHVLLTHLEAEPVVAERVTAPRAVRLSSPELTIAPSSASATPSSTTPSSTTPSSATPSSTTSSNATTSHAPSARASRRAEAG